MEKMTSARWATMNDDEKSRFFREWNGLTRGQKEALQSTEGLSPQLTGLEGYRVEVETTYGEKRRFIVGKSTGWQPCHLEISRRNSSGGAGAEKQYKSVAVLYKAR